MAQFIVVAVTLFGIYRQLHAQASANVLGRLEALGGRWESRLLVLARLRSAISLRYGEPQPGFTHDMSRIANFFTDLENLREEGHITMKEIDANWGTSIQVWMALLHARLVEQRAIDGDPGLFSGLDELAAILKTRRLARGGDALQIDAQSAPAWLDSAIAKNTAILELMHVAESDVIPMPPIDRTLDGEPAAQAT
jgi:hypothetical protein